MTEAPDGMVTVYVDPTDSQTYTYGASTIFEVYIYTTTQNIDVVGMGQNCGDAATAAPTPYAPAWNPLGSLEGLLGLASATATPYDPYATPYDAYAPLPLAGGSDNYSNVGPSAPVGTDGLPIYPDYDASIPFDAGPAPDAPGPVPSFDAGYSEVVPVPAAVATDAALPTPGSIVSASEVAPAPAVPFSDASPPIVATDAAPVAAPSAPAPLPFKRVVRAARRSPAAVEARATPVF
jgi:hypothetical protein